MAHNFLKHSFFALLILTLLVAGMGPAHRVEPPGRTPTSEGTTYEPTAEQETGIETATQPTQIHGQLSDNSNKAVNEVSVPPAAEESPKVALVQKRPQTIASPLIKEHVLGDSVVYTASEQTFPIRTYAPAITPNDPQSGQWWEASMNLTQAWDLGTGSTDTVLAIIDTGFALNHEEFVGRWHTNSGEAGAATVENPSQLNCTDQALPLDTNCNLIDDNFDGIVDNETGTTTRENVSQLNCTDQATALDASCNLIDDDSNGFIDDWRGWDFINFDRSVQPGETNQNGPGTRHGSYVAGVAAANANNGAGIAGVNWQTKVLPIQALADEGTGTTISVARSIRYAVSQGADVISMSLGSTYPDTFLRDAVTEAVQAGVIVVAASGNDGCNCISYPANYEEVVAVGALTSSNLQAGFSSYGANLDIMAPGVGLYTTTWSPTNQTNGYASGISGTSLATPLVSAALTLLLSHQPTATATDLLALLTENTNRLTLGSNENRSNTLGFGKTDLLAAASRATTPSNHADVVRFAKIGHGQNLFSDTNLEKHNTTNVFICSSGNYGTTAVYRLAKSGSVFYSSSLSEVGLAKANGYTAILLGYFCVAMSHDTISSIRLMDVFAEFESSFTK